MIDRPLIVYLDSQDYSNMANTKRHANERDLPSLLGSLRKFRASSNVKFVFSAISVAEAMPMTSSDVDLSLRQVRLLRELCGENALINYAKLVHAELANLSGRGLSSAQPLSGRFDWLPSGLERELGAPSELRTVQQEAIERVNASKAATADSGTRAAALKLAIQLVRDARLKSRRSRIEQGEFFYVQPKFHDVILRAAVGEASTAEKTTAFLESWNDLEWVVGLYQKMPDLADWYRDLVRQPNAGAASALRNFIGLMEGKEVPEAWKAGGWRRHRDNYLLSLVPDACKRLNLPSGDVTPKRIHERCPGLCAEAGVHWSLAWSYLTGGMKKAGLNSSAADAMHAAYAPYVDVFRTDRSMAPHVVGALESQQTRVVGDRRKLVETINNLLRERGAI